MFAMVPSFVFAKTPNDKQYYKQWYLEQIEAPAAWNEQTGSHDIIVAVLDAGVDLDHPDLKDNIWTNTGEIPGNGKDDDRNGYVDDIHGWDFVDFDGTPTPGLDADASVDAVIHGSLVSGLIGAKGNNKVGVSGVNWSVQIMPVRMLDSEGAGDSSSAAKAVTYAVLNGADVINMSFSGNTDDPKLRSVIRNAYEKGVVIVSAVGNESKDINSSPVYPACYSSGESDWVIGVAAVGIADAQTSFSNYGSDCVDLSAPGEDIFGVQYLNVAQGYDDAYSGGWSGTSMAAPLVAGAAAILLAEYPTLTPENVRNALKLSVDPLVLEGEFVGEFGAGRLNIANALAIAGNFVEAATDTDASDSDTPDTTSSDGTGLTFIKSPSYPTVYAIAGDERRAVVSALIYFTYENSFDSITAVTDEELALYSLAGLVLPKPGVVLVKIQSDPRVYSLEENSEDAFSPLLREIPDEPTAVS